MWKRLFGKKKAVKDTDNTDTDLEQRIREALRQAEEDKREALSDIQKIQSWAAEAIIDTYAHVFPNGQYSFYRDKYKDEALAKYDQLKAENADKVSTETSERCDQIVQGYRNQIALRESKTALYDKLIEEYTQTQSKFKHALQKAASTNKLDLHEERLKGLDDSTDTLAGAITGNYELDEITSEVEHREEYYKQLQALQTQYSDDSDFGNAIAYKEEVDKILKEIG